MKQHAKPANEKYLYILYIVCPSCVFADCPLSLFVTWTLKKQHTKPANEKILYMLFIFCPSCVFADCPLSLFIAWILKKPCTKPANEKIFVHALHFLSILCLCWLSPFTFDRHRRFFCWSRLLAIFFYLCCFWPMKVCWLIGIIFWGGRVPRKCKMSSQ